jgi:inorganic pyrophosphatase
MDFWQRLEQITESANIVIDRPRGSHHPRFPNIEYPLDYGFLEGVGSSDGNDLDVWCGSLEPRSVVGIVCTADSMKCDGEFKVLLGCSGSEIETIRRFHDSQYMSCVVVRRTWQEQG